MGWIETFISRGMLKGADNSRRSDNPASDSPVSTVDYYEDLRVNYKM